MTDTERGRQIVGTLQIHPAFFDFVERELLPAIGFDSGRFWSGLEAIIGELTPVNRQLLRTRDNFQQQIDDWHGSDLWQLVETQSIINFHRCAQPVVSILAQLIVNFRA